MEKVKLIQGNPERAEEIINILTNLGGINQYCVCCDDRNKYYFINCFGHIDYISISKAKSLMCEGVAEIYELPQQKHQFKPFDKVLVRDMETGKWKCDFFSHKEKGYYFCVSTYWNYCIPYEGNEYLLGTTDNPKPLYNTP